MVTENLTDPGLGKGKNGVFRYGGAEDIISIDEDPNDPEGNGYFMGTPADAGFYIDGGSGNDTITGSVARDLLVGGKGSDVIAGGLGEDIIYGAKMSGDEGKDRGTTVNILYGEAEVGTATVGDMGYADEIHGGDGAAGLGTDELFGNAIYGDYSILSVSGAFTYRGGSDLLFGGNFAHGVAAVNAIYGDAEFLYLDGGAFFIGGVDQIMGGDGSRNSLWGDVFEVDMADATRFLGGSDIITGGDGVSGGLNASTMWGDAQTINFTGSGATFTGGNDRLISGAGSNDVMYGDWAVANGDGVDGNMAVGGADRFEFSVSNGHDRIEDFELNKDKVVLSGFDATYDVDGDGVFDFDDLAGMWTTEFGFPTGDLALDLDGPNAQGMLGTGDLIVFEGYASIDIGDFGSDEFIFVT